jgi:hypothetical protein
MSCLIARMMSCIFGVFVSAPDDVEGLHQGHTRRHHGGELTGEDREI